MKKFEVNIDLAKKIYPNATKDIKQELETIFGRDEFIPKPSPPPPAPAYEILKGYENACEVIKLDPLRSLPFKTPESTVEKLLNITHKIMIFGAVVNKLDDFKPDYGTDNQNKTEPRFNRLASGFVFSSSRSAYWTTDASVGARLCSFRNSKVSDFVGTTIQSLYNEYFMLQEELTEEYSKI